jgi:hypothetical protein
MKKVKCCISLLLVCALFAATSVSAFARASEQINSYYMDVTPAGDGEIAIMFSVTGNGMMERLGAKSIRIFERGTYGWELTDSFDEDTPDMVEANSPQYGNTIYFQGEPGEQYQIIVTIFAEDKNGDSDSRSKTFTVTAR